MNAVFHRMQQWKLVPLDVIIVSLYHLSSFYEREIVRSIHQCGRWQVKDEYDFCTRDPSHMPRLQAVFDPSDIVDSVRKDLKSLPQCKNESIPNKECESRISLAKSALLDNRVKLVGNGSFVVIENDGVTTRAVRIFPKESCSCSSTKKCFHLAACQMSIGLEPHFDGKINLGELRRKERVKLERPSGRKRPRKHDFAGATETKTKISRYIFKKL